MAFIQTIYCPECEGQRLHTNGKCNDCRARRHQEEMAAWQAKTTEEKLLDLHKRLLRMEAGPIKY